MFACRTCHLHTTCTLLCCVCVFAAEGWVRAVHLPTRRHRTGSASRERRQVALRRDALAAGQYQESFKRKKGQTVPELNTQANRVLFQYSSILVWQLVVPKPSICWFVCSCLVFILWSIRTVVRKQDFPVPTPLSMQTRARAKNQLQLNAHRKLR